MPDRILVENGLVFDGLGGRPFLGSVVVGDGVILGAGFDASTYVGDRIDASGMAVAPGFIDMHTHSDVSIVSDPDCVSAVWQGVTTQIVGHCGFSAAPTNATTRKSMRREEPVFGFPDFEGRETEWGWPTISEYLAAVTEARPRTNIGTLVGHNTLRRLVVGSGSEEPTDEQLDVMAGMAVSSIDEGALGVTTGLSYPPGMYAGARETAAMAAAAASRGRRYHTHMRYGGGGIAESLEEALETGRQASAAVNVSHLYPSPMDPESESENLLEMIDRENRDGGDITFDLTLFVRGGGAWSQSLPPWAVEGGMTALDQRLEDPKTREKLLTEISTENVGRDWHDDLVVKVNSTEATRFVGRSLGESAREARLRPEELVVELLRVDPQFWIAPTIKRQSDLDMLIRHPRCVPVSDGMSAHPQRHSHLGLMPKTFGTFPLLFESYVRDRNVLELAEAVARVTSVPAQRMGLANRGRLTAGSGADIVVFDPDSIANTASDDHPAGKALGIRDVMVNGAWTMRDGQLTSDRAGRALT